MAYWRYLYLVNIHLQASPSMHVFVLSRELWTLWTDWVEASRRKTICIISVTLIEHTNEHSEGAQINLERVIVIVRANNIFGFIAPWLPAFGIHIFRKSKKQKGCVFESPHHNHTAIWTWFIALQWAQFWRTLFFFSSVNLRYEDQKVFANENRNSYDFKNLAHYLSAHSWSIHSVFIQRCRWIISVSELSIYWTKKKKIKIANCI